MTTLLWRSSKRVSGTTTLADDRVVAGFGCRDPIDGALAKLLRIFGPLLGRTAGSVLCCSGAISLMLSHPDRVVPARRTYWSPDDRQIGDQHQQGGEWLFTPAPTVPVQVGRQSGKQQGDRRQRAALLDALADICPAQMGSEGGEDSLVVD